MKAEVVFHFISSLFFAFYRSGFLVFSGGIKWEHQPEMGCDKVNKLQSWTKYLRQTSDFT